MIKIIFLYIIGKGNIIGQIVKIPFLFLRTLLTYTDIIGLL